MMSIEYFHQIPLLFKLNNYFNIKKKLMMNNNNNSKINNLINKIN